VDGSGFAIDELGLTDAIQTADGGYAIVGSIQFQSGEYGDAVLLKIDGDGKLVFQNRLGNKKSGETAKTIFSTADNGYVIFGSRDTLDSQSQLILRVNSKGKLSGCNYTAAIHSVEQKFISGIKTSRFQLKKRSQSFAIRKTDVTPEKAKVKESIEAVCE
jgi:hypothetical protein